MAFAARKIPPGNPKGRQNRGRPLAAWAGLASLLCLISLGGRAATLQWDADGVAANGAGGGTGTWDTTLLNWFNVASDVAWVNASNYDAVFAGTGGVVTTTTDLTANSLMFNAGPYTLFNSAAAQKLIITSGLISVATNQAATILVNLTNSVNATNVGVSKIGPGKLYLSKNPSFFGGLRVLEGTLSLSNKFQIGASGGSLTVNGGTLELTAAQASGNQTVSGRTLFLGNNGATIDVAMSPFGDWSFTDVQGTNGTLTKTGDGILTFSGPSARSGTTIINAGTMLANNTSSSSLGSGTVTVNANGTLGGLGRVAGLISGSGTISPGTTDVGTLTLQSGLNLGGGATYRWELAALKDDGSGVAGTDFDQLALTAGNLTLDGTSRLSINFAGTATAPDAINAFWQTNHTWKIIALSGSASNPALSNFSPPINASYLAGTFSTAVTNGSIVLRFVPTVGGSNIALITSTSSLNVPESGANTFTVRLNAQPTNEIAVATTFTSGDADLSITSGASLTFNSTNWNLPQTVTLAAAEDADTSNGTATFTVSSAGLTNRIVTATELDNDYMPPTNRPNFLIICTDDQRWDSLGAVQPEQGALARFPWFETPNLDRLAAEGVRFRNAFVVHSLCSPSRACMLTGRYGHLNGIVNNKTFFPTNAVTWATMLGAAGYTNGYVGKWHMGGQAGQRPGFHYSASFIGQGDYFDTPFEINGMLTNTTGWVDDVSTDYATNFITLNRSNAFALFIGYKSPHNPDDPPTRLLHLYTNVTDNPPLNASAVPAWDPNPSSSPVAKIRNYHRCVAGVDENVGRLLALLDQFGITSNTVVIFLSDNGRYLGDHGQGDKRSAYEESLRIPFLVRYPRLVAPSNLTDQIVLNLDIAPTILDLAGLPVPPEMQGRSLKPLLAGTPPPDWRQSYFYEYFIEGGSVVPNLYAFRTTTNKIVQYPDHEEWAELFNLVNDSYETNNLVGNPSYAQTYTNLQAILQQQMRDLGLLADMRSPTRNGNAFQFSLVGGIGPGWQVQSSTDLATWLSLASVQMTNVVSGAARATVSDSNASPPRKFYRARLISNE